MSPNDQEPVSAQLRADIEAKLLAYTRGIDRLDGELIAAAFHPEAQLEGYGRPEAMPIEAFIEYAVPSLREGYRATQHQISNVTIEPRGEYVATETYVLATHLRTGTDGAPDQLLTFAGRYIDRFEDRDGELRIAHRSLRNDWSKIEEVAQAMPGAYVAGSRDTSDISYPQA